MQPQTEIKYTVIVGEHFNTLLLIMDRKIVSYCFCNKSPPTKWLEIMHIHCLIDVEVRNSKWNLVNWDQSATRGHWESHFLAFPDSRAPPLAFLTAKSAVQNLLLVQSQQCRIFDSLLPIPLPSVWHWLSDSYKDLYIRATWRSKLCLPQHP